MERIPYFDAKAPVRVISPKTDKSCFFGYYDLQAYDETDSYHLCNIADFEDRLPTEKDVLEMGVIDLSNGNFERLLRSAVIPFLSAPYVGDWFSLKGSPFFLPSGVASI